MVVGGICASCKRYAHGLLTCKTCHSRVCPECFMGMFCKICQGKRMV